MSDHQLDDLLSKHHNHGTRQRSKVFHALLVISAFAATLYGVVVDEPSESSEGFVASTIRVVMESKHMVLGILPRVGLVIIVGYMISFASTQLIRPMRVFLSQMGDTDDDEVSDDCEDSNWEESTLVRLAVFVILAPSGAIVMGILGFNVTSLLTSLGLVGFAVGFVLRDFLSNLVEVVILMVYKPFNRLDYVDLGRGDMRGVVKSITYRYTTLVDIDEKMLLSRIDPDFDTSDSSDSDSDSDKRKKKKKNKKHQTCEGEKKSARKGVNPTNVQLRKQVLAQLREDCDDLKKVRMAQRRFLTKAHQHFPLTRRELADVLKRSTSHVYVPNSLLLSQPFTHIKLFCRKCGQ